MLIQYYRYSPVYRILGALARVRVRASDFKRVIDILSIRLRTSRSNLKPNHGYLSIVLLSQVATDTFTMTPPRIVKLQLFPLYDYPLFPLPISITSTSHSKMPFSINLSPSCKRWVAIAMLVGSFQLQQCVALLSTKATTTARTKKNNRHKNNNEFSKLPFILSQYQDVNSGNALTMKRTRRQLMSSMDICNTEESPFLVPKSSLQHLQDTELPDDPNRKRRSPETIRAFLYGTLSAIGLTAITLAALNWIVDGQQQAQQLLHLDSLFELIQRGGVVSISSAVDGDNNLNTIINIPILLQLATSIGSGFSFGFFILGNGRDSLRKDKLARRPKNGGYDRNSLADQPIRLKTILNYFNINSNDEYNDIGNPDRKGTAMYFANQVHSPQYIQFLQSKTSETDRPIRLNPRYSRTLIDQYSFRAAMDAASTWINCVDHVILQSSSPSSRIRKASPSSPSATMSYLNKINNENNVILSTTTMTTSNAVKPKFALVRPPSHHACQSKGMGGCLLSSVVIAAKYALEQYPEQIQQVAILDIDAHFGNGIAHCVQDLPNIRYCSIHEETPLLRRRKRDDADKDTDDPRLPDDNDYGPLGNIKNFNLPPNTGWENGYQETLVDHAIPFLLYGDTKYNDDDDDSNNSNQKYYNTPDLLLVAAGFDALDSDWTSTLQLAPKDYYKIASVLEENFGTNTYTEGRIAMGLEGGYSWQEGDLCVAIEEFINPWYK